ncbi:hypothetical protein AZA_84542 [Nitrospirillum viridazoti Y2]|nr:hypothetical protein AZA_84542 [Nitrospirillum amazonense Y2]
MALQVGHFLFQAAALLHQGGDAGRHLGGGNFQGAGGGQQAALLPFQVLERAPAGQRLDTAHAGGDGALRHDLEQADVTGAAHMGAAAQLHGVLTAQAFVLPAHADDADLVAVLLPEQRHGALLDGLGRGHQAGDDLAVAQDAGVHCRLDHAHVVIRQRRRLADVEAQALRRHQRALLRDMLAQALAQGLVQQVSGGVVGADVAPAAAVHAQLHQLSGRKRAVGDGADVGEDGAQLLLRVADGHLDATGAEDHAAVAHLAAGLAIERRLVHQDDDVLAGGGLVQLVAVAVQHGRDLALGVLGVVAQELGGAQLILQLEPHPLGRGLAAAGPGLARLGPLTLHGGGEAIDLDGAIAAAQHVLRQVQGEAVGVVQLERHLAGQGLTGTQLFLFLVQQLQAAVQRLLEPGFLQPQGLGDQGLGALQLGVVAAHLAHQRRHQLVHHRVAGADHVGVAHGAAHDAAQDIAASLVRRQHAVGDEEGGGAQMVGDDAVRHGVRARRVAVGGIGRRLDQRAHQVGVVIVVHALQHRRQALQPHAGVDGGPGQGHPLLLRHLLILHEHQVPDFDEAVAVLVRAAGGAAGDALAMVVENLGARAAGAGVAHGPEIVGRGDADDAVVRQAGHLLPQAMRLVIGVVDRDQQLVLGQGEGLGDQVPGQLDGVGLEIIAEGEVAQHLEEGVVPSGIAHILQVVMLAAGAHALLRGGGAGVGAHLVAGEDVLELHHAGVGEHQRRVVARHQRAGLHLRVAVLHEVVQESGADLVGGLHRATALSMRRNIPGRETPGQGL